MDYNTIMLKKCADYNMAEYDAYPKPIRDMIKEYDDIGKATIVHSFAKFNGHIETIRCHLDKIRKDDSERFWSKFDVSKK